MSAIISCESGRSAFDLDDRPFVWRFRRLKPTCARSRPLRRPPVTGRGAMHGRQQNAGCDFSSFQQAEDQLLSAEADVAVAQAQLDQAQANLDHARYGSSERVHHQSDGAAGDHVAAYRPGCSDQCGRFPRGRLFRDADPDFRPATGADHAHDQTDGAAEREAHRWTFARTEHREALLVAHVRVDGWQRTAAFTTRSRTPCTTARTRPFIRRHRVHLRCRRLGQYSRDCVKGFL